MACRFEDCSASRCLGLTFHRGGNAPCVVVRDPGGVCFAESLGFFLHSLQSTLHERDSKL